MKKSSLFLIGILVLIIGIVIGIYLAFFGEDYQVGKSKLYNCIYNNLQSNNFPQNDLMIKKIENECICFREHNFTNLLEVDCSNYVLTNKSEGGNNGQED